MKSINYKKLWILLLQKNISKQNFREMCNISTGTMTKLNKDEMVALTVLDRICCVLNADYGDIMQHVPAEENEEAQETIA